MQTAGGYGPACGWSRCRRSQDSEEAGCLVRWETGGGEESVCDLGTWSWDPVELVRARQKARKMSFKDESPELDRRKLSGGLGRTLLQARRPSQESLEQRMPFEKDCAVSTYCLRVKVRQ